MGIGRTMGVVVFAISVGVGVARADTGYEGDDLSLRLRSAFTRLSEVSRFGGETVANRWTATSNPASADWGSVLRPDGAVAEGFLSDVVFEAPTEIRVYGVDGLVHTGGAGTGSATLGEARSNDGTDLSGARFDYEVEWLQLQWAKRWGVVGAGISFRFEDSEWTRTVGGTTVHHCTEETYRVRGGLLAEPICGWVLGLTAEYGWTPFEYDGNVPTACGMTTVSGSDTQEQVLVRGGVSYEYRACSTVFADYQYGRFENDTGVLETNRFNVGVQHHAFGLLFLHAGITADDHGNVGWMAGVAASLGRRVILDVGYQHDTLPELTPDFGTSDTIELTLSVWF